MPVRHAKQVRFAYKNVFHSPPVTPSISAMPPLTFSSSTVPSSAGVLTPPSNIQPLPLKSAMHPHTYQDSKSSSASRYAGYPRCHPYLEMGAITWDLMDPPSTITRHHQSISTRAWTEAATSPPMSFIVVTIPHFAWKFNIYASNRAFVTFEDVVETIYRSLRKNITESEFHSAASPAEQRRASRAYEHRYRRQRNSRMYEEEKRAGMKRVDFLMGHTRFGGLTSGGHRSDEWRLDVT